MNHTLSITAGPEANIARIEVDLADLDNDDVLSFFGNYVYTDGEICLHDIVCYDSLGKKA